ncbi:transformation/transcription domain-associated protein-like [Belonocnema kinseyi]|uniref:transformation/transcription domain-associated protein-like n=1 Tax=Belonocnema kinseyi TaxID=2817044 RepID=UPI00143D77DA|nr:transformation/transcription domain-associated protein-like [Belonocnema kinseyi]
MTQALRTLELCVDNLEPAFFYAQFRPVVADLIQSLWRIIRDPSEQTAQVAFRILGKLAGENRKVLIDPQKIEYTEEATKVPAIITTFEKYSRPIGFSVDKVVAGAYTILNSSADVFYKKQASDIINSYLAASITINDDSQTLLGFFNHASFKEAEIIRQQGPFCINEVCVARNVHKTALSGLFLAVLNAELKTSVLGNLIFYLRHYTMVAIAQQAGPFPLVGRQAFARQDPLVIIDAIKIVMGHENKELSKFGHLALLLILETATTILGSKERACQLPLMEYLAEKMTSLCYERAWYTKLGGCVAINFFSEKMSLKWILNHLINFVKALIFVMMDLSEEISNGAIDMAKTNLETLLRICANPEIEEKNPEILETQQKSLREATRELMRQITSPHSNVREEAIALLGLLAEIRGETLISVMEPHKDILADMIPPIKHRLVDQPVNTQIGLMEGNTFCLNINPSLFSVNLEIPEHKMFYQDLLFIIMFPDDRLLRKPCYKSVTDFTPLKKSAIRAFASYQNLCKCRDDIFKVLYTALDKPNEIRETAFECMKKLNSVFPVKKELVDANVESMIESFKDPRNIKTNSLKRLVYMSEIFPYVFSGMLCDQMFQHLKVFLENLVEAKQGISKSGEIEMNIVMIIELLEKTPTASAKWISPICKTVLGAEKKLMIEASSPFRVPVMRFLLRYPSNSMEFFLKDNIQIDSCGRFLEFLLKHEEGKPFRDCIQEDPGQLREILFEFCRSDSNQSLADKSELRYRAIKILSILRKFDNQWLPMQNDLILIIRQIWEDDDYQTLHRNLDYIDTRHWKEPKLIAKILLHFFSKNPNDIDLLFQLLRSFSGSFTTDFEFLKEFLQNTVAQDYTVEWKRNVFFKFVEYFPKYFISQELKASILKYILIPCFAASFEKGDGTKLIGGSPTPYEDNPNNVVSVFINQIIATENNSKIEDSLRIYVLRFACLLVEKASQHIHEVTNKTQSQKVRRLMCFAWPCLSTEKCVDPVSKYHGHLLLSHIIAKFSISEKIVVQVFYSLLKAFAVEARLVVREAFEVLFPALAHRMKEGSTVMHTKNVILEDGYTSNHLCHILTTIVTNYKAYYPERHQLIHTLVNSISKLGSALSLEQRTIAVDISETIIKWELERVKSEPENFEAEEYEPAKRSSNEILAGTKRFAIQGGNISPIPIKIEAAPKIKLDTVNRIDSHHANVVLNFLFQLCCELNPTSPQQANQIDFLTTRSVNLLKLALNPKIWFHLCNFKISWLQKIFSSLETSQPIYQPICKALELLLTLIGLMQKEQVLSMFSDLENELGACVSSSNMKIQNLVFALFSKLMKIFPPEPFFSTVACQHQELDSLYQSIAKLIRDGLSNYEKDVNATFSSLSNSLTLLNASCTSNQNYIDGLMSLFMKVVYKITVIHTNSRQNQIDSTGSDLLILSLNLLKNKIGVMDVEDRKTFVNTILVALIGRSQDLKVMKAIVTILEEWIRNKDPVMMSQHPCLREKSLLLFKMMQNIELRFPSDLELVSPFLDIILFIYKDKSLNTTELTMKLQPAFLSGLRSIDPQIRIKFFDVFNGSMEHQLLDRLFYIVCSQGWDMIGRHYWIKQCIELLMVTASHTSQIQLTDEDIVLPSIKSLMNLTEEPNNCFMDTFMNEEPEKEEKDTKDLDLDFKLDSEGNIAGRLTLTDLVTKHCQFLDRIKSIRTLEFLTATCHLCHVDTNLAEQVWLDTFPKLWDILSEEEQLNLTEEVVPFVCSGSHLMQKDCQPSAVATFLEALSRCNPPIPMKPAIMKYLGKSHNIWHRMTLGLEHMILESKPQEFDCYDFEPVDNPNNEILDALGDMYSLLTEDDMWSGLWQKHAHYKETKQAIALEQQGFFEQAQVAYDLAMTRFKTDFVTSSAPVNIQKEVLLWEEHWIRCAKELGQWDLLSQYSKTTASKDPFLILDSSWRLSDWNLMQESLEQVKQKAPKEMSWKINLYKGFLAIHCTENQNLIGVKKCVEMASVSCIREWRRLPHIVSQCHLPILQATQKIIELQEAMEVQQTLLLGKEKSFLPLKSIVKTWKNRFPSIADDLLHWSNIFAWRELHYKSVINFFDSQPDEARNLSKHFVHAWAHTTNMFGRVARKHNLSSVCLDSLTKIHGVESVTIVDCYQKIKQQVKCYLQMASIRGNNDLKNALNCIESTEIGYFKKGMNSELFALKGKLFSLMGDSDEANKAFSASVQMNENSVKAWALWGDYLEQVFIGEPSQIAIGVSAITCFLKASKHHNESKSRKYIAKVLWLLNYDDENKSLLQQVDKSVCEVHPIHWLPWIPQILMWLVHVEGEVIVNLLNVIGRMYPQAVYFPIRTLYVTLKAGKIQGVVESQVGKLQQQAIRIEASKPMVRCSTIMKKLREIHPTIISSLEAIVDQVTRLREPWHGEVLRHLRQILTKCYAVIFENQDTLNTTDVRITSHILYIIKKLVATFGLGMENISSQNENRSATSEALARRIQVTCQDPVFQKMKSEFAQDFDLNKEQTALVCHLIPTLKKWIKILEDKAKISPRSFLLEEKCRFLRHFSLQTADIVMPGGYLLPKYFNYHVKISKFLPRVEIVQRHNSTVHRLRILGDNGLIYPYLIVMNDGSGDARRDERVLQLMRMLNLILKKQKETARRLLQFTIPKVISLNSQMQLVEDNPSAISLMDIYKESCEKRGVLDDAAIALYYERLDNLKARGIKLSHQVLRKIYTEVQTKIVPKTIIRDWALKTFPGATEYWTFRKMFTLQVSLACFAEYALHLTRLNPDMIYLHRDSGLMNVAYYKFDLDKTSGQLISNRPVPFRLTPNILELVSDIGVLGPLTASAIATARCLVQPSYQIEATLRAILRDEIVDDRSKKFRIENAVKPEVEKRQKVITNVTSAVASVSKRLNSLAYFDGNDSRVKNLFATSTNPDNLCQMDPTWHPWL